MAIWLVRAGQWGENQDFALEQNLVIIGWDAMPDLAQFTSREEMEKACDKAYPGQNPGTITNWTAQLWAFSHRIKIGHLVALPLKGRSAIAFGRVIKSYTYKPDNPEGAKHTIPVQWIVQDMPRSKIEKDLLYSLGAAMTVCQIQRNNAEARIRTLLGEPTEVVVDASEELSMDSSDSTERLNLQEYAHDEIMSFIGRKFAGHGLADLINAVLTAQGFHTEVSPPVPDGGVDIIAGKGPMGFDSPRLCVQVKSGDSQQDVKVIRELHGTMKEMKADQGIFVSWGGFKRSVLTDSRRQFFEMRLWDAGNVVDAVMKYYDQFPEDLKAELPLKRIWTLVKEDE